MGGLDWSRPKKPALPRRPGPALPRPAAGTVVAWPLAVLELGPVTSFWPAQRGHVEPGQPLPGGPVVRDPARARRPSAGGRGPGPGGKSPWPEPRNAIGSYGAVTRGLQDPGRGLSPGLPDAPARWQTVAGERTRRTEERSGHPGRAFADAAFLSWPLSPGGPEPHLGIGKERPWLPLTPAVRVSGRGWLPLARQ